MATSCPAGCTRLLGARFDEAQGCVDFSRGQMVLGCTSGGEPPPITPCVKRVSDGALFIGAATLPHLPGWTECNAAEEEKVRASCPPDPAYGVRVEVGYEVATGRKGVTLRWTDGTPTKGGEGFALLDRRFGSAADLDAWKGSFELAVAGKVVHTEEVSNDPCRELTRRLGYQASDFHVSRYVRELSADETHVTGQSHVPFDGPTSCYRELAAGAPAFGAVDLQHRVLRWWMKTANTSLRLGTPKGERMLPERLALVLEPRDALVFGMSFAWSFPLSTPAAQASVDVGLWLTTGGDVMAGSGGTAGFEKCQVQRSDLYVEERDLIVDGPTGFDANGRVTCCYGDGCVTSQP